MASTSARTTTIRAPTTTCAARRTIRRGSTVRRSAEAAEKVDATSTEVKQFYFCVANADFMLNDENNEHFPEILRERRRFYKEKAKPQDFWVVPNPAFLDAMPDVKAKVRQPCVAVVTTDKVWNDFVKLRMDRVYKGGVEGATCDILKSNAPIDPDSFAKPANWTAPYAKYAAGWWSVFEPNGDF